MSKAQAIVLKHLYLLLGFNEKLFYTAPQKLRYSAVFNAFIANLPQFLDQNSTMGAHMMGVIIQVLLFCPNPSNVPGGGMELMHNISLTYSLWYLEPHVRRSWLMSILVILYKYQYTIPPLYNYIENTIRVVLNSIEAQFHQCRRIPATVIMDLMPSRSRDMSQPSLGNDGDDRDQSTPPMSPMPEGSSHSGTKSKGKVRRQQDSSLEADDTEAELVAIPESDMSDSTFHGSSAANSFDDPNVNHFDEVCAPLKLDSVTPRSDKGSAHIAGNMKVTERKEDRIETTKKVQKIKAHSKSVDRTGNEIILTSSSTTVEAITSTTVQTRCTVQEGVRMMVTSSIMGDKALVNPPVQVQKAIIVSQPTKFKDSKDKTQNKSKDSTDGREMKDMSTSKMMASIASNQLKAFGAFTGPMEKKSPSIEQESTSSTSSEEKHKDKTKGNPSQRSSSPRSLGRQKRIVEASGPPIAQMSIPSTSGEEFKVVTGKPPHKKSFRSIERTTYGSPESPLSKMDIMSPPPSSDGAPEALLSPKSVSSLEIPTQERLLPIGPMKETVASLADRVREALVIPDISHLKQDSTEKSDSTSSPREDVTSSSRPSPRKLKKQTALESPPVQGDDLHSTLTKAVTHEVKVEKHDGPKKSRRLRKVGPFTIGSQNLPDSKLRYAGSWAPNSMRDDSDPEDEASAVPNDLRQSCLRIGDDCVAERCMECGALIETYTDEEMGLFVVILGTFIHREPALAAPYLPDILQIVSK